MSRAPRLAYDAAGAIAGLWLAFALPTAAAALDEDPADWDRLKACEKSLCTMILDRKPAGDNLACKLAKTWPKSTLDGGEGKLVKWGYGDARCSVDLGLDRAAIVSALSEPAFTYEIPEHHVSCQVESGGEMKDVKVRLAPRIDFKNGKAKKIWINLKDVTGPGSIKATVWAAANVQDTLGVFHKNMLKSVNKFMHKQCAERYGPGAVASGSGKDGEKRKSGTAEADASAEPAETKPSQQVSTAGPAPGGAKPDEQTAAEAAGAGPAAADQATAPGPSAAVAPAGGSKPAAADSARDAPLAVEAEARPSREVEILNPAPPVSGAAPTDKPAAAKAEVAKAAPPKPSASRSAAKPQKHPSITDDADETDDPFDPDETDDAYTMTDAPPWELPPTDKAAR